MRFCVATLILMFAFGPAPAEAVPKFVRAKNHGARSQQLVRKRARRIQREQKAREQKERAAKKRAAKRARRWARTKRTLRAIGHGLEGLFVEGPRHTWHAIKARPRLFVTSVAISASFATLGHMAGLPAHKILVGGTALLASIDVVRQIRGLRHRKDKARGVGRVLWSPAITAATTGAGTAIIDVSGHPAVVMGGESITAGDAPIVASVVMKRNGKVVKVVKTVAPEAANTSKAPQAAAPTPSSPSATTPSPRPTPESASK